MKDQIKYRGFSFTWFPMEGMYMVFKGLEISSKFLSSEDECKNHVDNLLKKENNDN